MGRTLRRMISIHAPREGCDPAACPRSHSSSISIHAPREGCDYAGDQERKAHVRFQSTHPARGATRDRFDHGSTPLVISIHAPREGCDYNIGHGLKLDKISIHAPREGCDVAHNRCLIRCGHFNPRTPRGVRPYLFTGQGPFRQISIHAPREGCDIVRFLLYQRPLNFNPRTPRGVRQQTLPKSREFAWLNLLICTRGRRLSIQKQTRLCSIKLSFMLFGCEPAGEGVSSWTSHATKSKVRLEGRSA